MRPEFAPIAFLAAISLLIPLPWHWRAGNVATLSIMFWLFVSNIIYAVDAIIWGDNVDIVVPVWCDITSKLIIGSNFALPAACLCICIHLEQVASVRLARTTRSDKQRRQMFEAFMCFGLPLFFMGLHYVVQGHRFDIIEEYGCRPTTYVSVPAIFIVWIPPLIMAVVCLVFAALAFRHFILRRITFAAHLAGSNSALTTSRYLRLMLMSALQMIWSITVTSYTLWYTIFAVPLRPWTSWSDVHSNFSRIDLYPAAFTPPMIVSSEYALWWMVPASTFIFVAFFAFGRDAIVEYKKCFMWFRTRVLRQTVVNEGSKGSFGSLPTPRSAGIRAMQMSMNATSTASSALPAYKPPTPPTPKKYRSHLDDPDYDSHSDMSHNSSSFSYPAEPKVIGSLADLPPSTPSTPVSPLTPPGVRDHISPTLFSSLPPPPPPQARNQPGQGATGTGNQSPTSPRPFTYPSLDASHRGIKPLSHDAV